MQYYILEERQAAMKHNNKIEEVTEEDYESDMTHNNTTKNHMVSQ